jgi:hypothetical protein
MRGAIPLLPQYAFMARCSVKKSTGTTLLVPYERESTITTASGAWTVRRDQETKDADNRDEISTCKQPDIGVQITNAIQESGRSHMILATYDNTAVLSGKVAEVRIGYEGGWAPEPIWTLWRWQKPPPPAAGNLTLVVQPVYQLTFYWLYKLCYITTPISFNWVAS